MQAAQLRQNGSLDVMIFDLENSRTSNSQYIPPGAASSPRTRRPLPPR
jgi:hypothetical protein